MMFIPNNEYQRILEVLPILCVDCVITYQNSCLLLLRKNEPAKGQWWFPGGRLQKGEIIKDAAIRKASEEVNLSCRFEKVISIEETIFGNLTNHPSEIHTVNICCHLSTLEAKSLAIDSHHDDYRWVSAETAKSLGLHDSVLRPLLANLES